LFLQMLTKQLERKTGGKKMENKIYFNRIAAVLRRKCFISICVVALVLFLASPGMAFEEIQLFGKPFKAMGFINLGVGYGIGGDHYDTKEDWQSFKYDILLETQYDLSPDFRIFISGMLSGDWAYDILAGDDEWEDKGFSDSRRELSHDTVLRDLLQEAHFTWTPGNFLFRMGKQIVVWGETDGFRIMDQINPLDTRRGITDVEFETTILPIWLAKVEYFMQPDSSWLQDLGFEFIFNPNADFQPNRGLDPGSEIFGIWGADSTVFLGGPYPFDFAHVGSWDTDFDEPDDWDSDYFEYGFRVKSIVNDTIITLNYFYGRDNDYVAKFNPLPPTVTGAVPSAYDGRMIFNLRRERKYPIFRIAGFTLTRDFENLYIGALGGVAPVLRLEAFYGFSNTFEAVAPGYVQYDFVKRDEIRYAIGVDWKIKVNWLNPRAYFFISPQFYQRHILDYPSGYTLSQGGGATPLRKDNYMTSLMVMTTYFHNKLEPSFFWLADRTNHSGFYRPQLKYIYSDIWDFTLGAIFINARKKMNPGFHALENKDHVYFTIAYKF